MIGNKAYPSGAPPQYSAVDMHTKTAATGSKWNPLHWPLWGKILGGVIVVAVIIAIIVGAVEGSKADSYPNYSKLTYNITDRYEGEDFFNDFDFYTGYDPAEGFVQ